MFQPSFCVQICAAHATSMKVQHAKARADPFSGSFRNCASNGSTWLLGRKIGSVFPLSAGSWMCLESKCASHGLRFKKVIKSLLLYRNGAERMGCLNCQFAKVLPEHLTGFLHRDVAHGGCCPYGDYQNNGKFRNLLKLAFFLLQKVSSMQDHRSHA